jgi:hypothetical protein
MATVGPLEDEELLAEGKDLGVQRRAGSKSLQNGKEQREDDRRHGSSKQSRRPFKFNRINENGIFGRDRGTCLAEELSNLLC